MSEVNGKYLDPIRTVVYDPIFKQEIQVFCNVTEADWMRWQKRRNIVNAEGINPNQVAFLTHITADDEPNIYIIWLNRFDWTLNDQESLIHEITHTVVRIWEANNIRFVPETQEFFAHSVGRLYALIGQKLMNRKPKKQREDVASKSA